MEKWYLSENGNVNGPFGIADVQRLVSKNSDLYGWNPSYSHWLPVIKIQEFKEFLIDVKSSKEVSKELIDKFVNKKRDLNKKAGLIERSIEATLKTMASFEQEISNYKELTKNLSPEVKDNIAPLEKKYNGIRKQLKDLQKAAVISKKEIDDAVKEFGGLVLNKTTENNEDFAEFTDNTVKASPKSKMSDVDELIPSVEPVKNIAKTVRDTKPKVKVPVESIQLEEVNTESKSDKVEKSNSSVNKDQSAKVKESEKKGFADVKNKLKSVFSHKDETPIKLSDQLKQLEKEVIEEEIEEEVIYLEVDGESDLENDDEPKKKRRRRRRF